MGVAHILINKMAAKELQKDDISCQRGGGSMEPKDPPRSTTGISPKMTRRESSIFIIFSDKYTCSYLVYQVGLGDTVKPAIVDILK